MEEYFASIAPTLAKRSKLNVRFPIANMNARNAIFIPSDPAFDENAGSFPADDATSISFGGEDDGRVYSMGGYPLAERGSVGGGPGVGTHSDLGNWQSNNAVDINVPVGVPVLATQDGVIKKTYLSPDEASSRFAGHQVTMTTGDNEWFYTHLSKLAKGLKPGAKVKKGQVIGYSGVAADTPHLHIGVKYGNPLDLLGLRKK